MRIKVPRVGYFLTFYFSRLGSHDKALGALQTFAMSAHVSRDEARQGKEGKGIQEKDMVAVLGSSAEESMTRINLHSQ